MHEIYAGHQLVGGVSVYPSSDRVLSIPTDGGGVHQLGRSRIQGMAG